ncbi:hypothetical protein LTR86_001832 [Recurvomyces mirabilis]|nr:hypothetical protein LTR86_001832 [Recurvomyces mirabilis]
MDSQHIDHRSIDAIPGVDLGNLPLERCSISPAIKAPTSSYLRNPLPPEDLMIMLVEEYFESVHWFSLVILESKFRPLFDSVRTGLATQLDKTFLLLLSTVLGLASWYRGHLSRPKDEGPPNFWEDLSSKLLENSESQIIEIMNQNSVTAVQIMILLGSFHIYHGRPNLSFSLLGATVRAAQAAGLHREPVHGVQADREEKKRVWWTIYTWDRFASITYGRPLGINDKDCNIGQPDDVLESTRFSEPPSGDDDELICFSLYQRELNKLYMIASPAIENIYNVPEIEPLGTLGVAAENLRRVKEVTSQLWHWRSRLPDQLCPRLESDCSHAPSPRAKTYCLQSLSLQLTFDSLIIVLHRPFITQRPDLALSSPSVTSSAMAGSQDLDAHRLNFGHSPALSFPNTSAISDISSPHQWWEAAIRVSRVTKLPQLAEFACDSHLAAFLAISLFNAAMVMVVVALSDPLMDKAQEAKRAVARIYRLQEALGSRSTLSKQSSSVLRSLVQLLLRRETEAILAPMTSGDITASRRSSVEVCETDPNRIPVRDALSMPFGYDFGRAQGTVSSNTSVRPDLSSRLNHSLATVQKGTTPSFFLVQCLFYLHASAFANSSALEVLEQDSFQSSRTTSEGGLHRGPSQPLCEESRDLHQLPVQTPGYGWTAGSGIDDSGLYWFWDPTWDDIYINAHL